MATTIPSMEALVHAAVMDAVQKEADRLIKKAQEDIAKSVQEQVAQIAMRIMKHYTMSQMGDTITIRVDINEKFRP